MAITNPAAAPDDRHQLVYGVFYWLGIGTLLPWNFFIAVSDYWMYKWRSLDGLVAAAEGQLNEMQTTWTSNLASASMVPNVTFLLLNAALGHRFRTQPRLLISLVAIIVLFAFTAAMALVDTDSWQADFMKTTVACVVLINISGAIFQGGLLGVAGRFPPKYIGGVFAGQALGGLFASVTNVLVKVLGADQSTSAFVCFSVAVAFLALALISYLLVTRQHFYQFHVGEGDHDRGMKPDEKPLDQVAELQLEVAVTVSVNPFRVLRRIYLYAVSIFLTFAITLSCFPALTVLIVSTDESQSAWADVYFVPVICFVLFNVGDYVGRMAAQHLGRPAPGRAGCVIVFALTLARLSFVVLFLLCNANPKNRSLTAVYIESDAAYALLMALFSLSNGYLSNNCMMSAPQLCPAAEQQTAASIMVACLGLGLGAGALISRLVLMAL